MVCVCVCVLCVVWNVVPVDIFINKDVRHIIKKEGKSKKHKQIFWDFSNQSVVKNMRNLFNQSINQSSLSSKTLIQLTKQPTNERTNEPINTYIHNNND